LAECGRFHSLPAFAVLIIQIYERNIKGKLTRDFEQVALKVSHVPGHHDEARFGGNNGRRKWLGRALHRHREYSVLNHQSLSNSIWSVADLLRGDYKQSEYGRVILPFIVLRRLDCVLAPTKEAVLNEAEAGRPDPFLVRAAGHNFLNRSPLDLVKLIGDQDNIGINLLSYVQGFSPEVHDIFEQFEFAAQIDRLTKNGLLYQVTERFAGIDLHPARVDNMQMGLAFEELIRKFAEISNETAGEHFTPREVIRLMVNLIFVEDDDVLSKLGVVRSIYDPTAGTGAMLSIAGEYLPEHNPQVQLAMSGQELNPESYAIYKADMLINSQNITKIAQGNTLSDDGHAYLVASRIDPASKRLSRSCCVRSNNAAVSTSYAMRWPMPTRAVDASSTRLSASPSRKKRLGQPINNGNPC